MVQRVASNHLSIYLQADPPRVLRIGLVARHELGNWPNSPRERQSWRHFLGAAAQRRRVNSQLRPRPAMREQRQSVRGRNHAPVTTCRLGTRNRLARVGVGLLLQTGDQIELSVESIPRVHLPLLTYHLSIRRPTRSSSRYRGQTTTRLSR